MTNTIILKRRVSGAAGSPASLKSGEIAWNMADDTLYGGKGDDGSGNATSIVPLGGTGLFAPKASPAFTGTPTAPTAAPGTNTTQLATTAFVQAALSGTGAGDMLKSVYDPNDDGKVTSAASADSVPWSGVSAKPSEFPPADFDALKIVSGVIDIARIPDFAASKVTSGTFNADRIPNLDASKITTGVIDIARIPVLPSQIQIASSGGIADLSAPQQTSIGSGTVVTTTDGRRWVYSGSGSKTLEASYIELADITPDWSVIANKPTTFTPSAHTHTLSQITDAGTMASQNASSVNITGGSISNVTLDGGTF